MPQDFLIGKQSLLKVESTRNYVKENKVQLSVDADLLRNKNYNRFDVSKDPKSAFISNIPVSTFDSPVGNSINYIPIVYTSMSLFLDASNVSSYPGSGNTWYDLSDYGNNFTLSNSPTYSSSFIEFKTNQAATCINTTCGNFGEDSFTFEYIAFYTGSSNIDSILVKRSGIFAIGVQNLPGWAVRQGAATWWVQDNNPGNTQANNINNVVGEISYNSIPYTSSIVHMAFVIEKNGASSTGSRYKNGVLQSVDKKKFIGNNSVNNNSNMLIAYAMTGSISVVRTYKRALSADEVLQNFNSTKNKYGL